MTFKQFLIEKEIPYIEFEDGSLGVNDNLIIPYELEFRNLFPNEELIWDYRRYRNEPKRINDER